MLSKRVLVIAADKPFQRRLVAGAMAAGGAVTAIASLDEHSGPLDADLVLYAMGWSITDPQFTSLLARLPGEARLVPILPAPQLANMVELLVSERISTVLVAEEISAQTISQTVSKLLYGDLFGLEKLMPWGVRIYSIQVGDYQEKSLAIATIGDFAQAMGVRRKYREQIDQCIDEMLMNALFDAPVDAQGRQLFAEVPVKERVALRLADPAVVQYACDGARFAVAVRDRFGSLAKSTVLQYLDKCLHSDGAQQIDHKVGGAGLGLYLMANAATEIYFHIFDGKATEVVCSFDLQAPRCQLRSLGVFQESLELVAQPQVVPPRSGSGIRPLPLRPGRRREDHAPPPPEPRAPPMLAVTLSAAVVLLLFSGALAGMPWLRRGPEAALRLPAEPPGAAEALPRSGPTGEGRARYRVVRKPAREATTLAVEIAPPEAAATVAIDGQPLPPDAARAAVVEPGALHHVKVSAPGFVDFRADVTLAEGERRALRVQLEEGGVLLLKTNVVARVLVDDHAVGSSPLLPLALAEGEHTLALEAERPRLRYRGKITIEKGRTVEERLDFGTVEIAAPGVTADGATLLALPAGPRKLALSNKDTGETREREVVIPSAGKLIIDTW